MYKLSRPPIIINPAPNLCCYTNVTSLQVHRATLCCFYVMNATILHVYATYNCLPILLLTSPKTEASNPAVNEPPPAVSLSYPNAVTMEQCLRERPCPVLIAEYPICLAQIYFTLPTDRVTTCLCNVQVMVPWKLTMLYSLTAMSIWNYLHKM